MLIFITEQEKPRTQYLAWRLQQSHTETVYFSHKRKFVWLCIISVVSHADKKDYKMFHVACKMFTFHHRTLLLHASQILTENELKWKLVVKRPLLCINRMTIFYNQLWFFCAHKSVFCQYTSRIIINLVILWLH